MLWVIRGRIIQREKYGSALMIAYSRRRRRQCENIYVNFTSTKGFTYIKDIKISLPNANPIFLKMLFQHYPHKQTLSYPNRKKLHTG